MLACSPAWLNLARENVPVTVAADEMKCHKKTAEKMLGIAERLLDPDMTPKQEEAVAVLKSSALANPKVSRKRWREILEN